MAPRIRDCTASLFSDEGARGLGKDGHSKKYDQREGEELQSANRLCSHTPTPFEGEYNVMYVLSPGADWTRLMGVLFC